MYEKLHDLLKTSGPTSWCIWHAWGYIELIGVNS